MSSDWVTGVAGNLLGDLLAAWVIYLIGLRLFDRQSARKVTIVKEAADGQAFVKGRPARIRLHNSSSEPILDLLVIAGWTSFHSNEAAFVLPPRFHDAAGLEVKIAQPGQMLITDEIDTSQLPQFGGKISQVLDVNFHTVRGRKHTRRLLESTMRESRWTRLQGKWHTR